MDEAERARIREELLHRQATARHRVIITRADGSQSIFARGLTGPDAFGIILKLNLENGVSATYELDEPGPYVRALGIDPDAKPESN